LVTERRRDLRDIEIPDSFRRLAVAGSGQLPAEEGACMGPAPRRARRGGAQRRGQRLGLQSRGEAARAPTQEAGIDGAPEFPMPRVGLGAGRARPPHTQLMRRGTEGAKAGQRRVRGVGVT
jgi:hypothetical protein